VTHRAIGKIDFTEIPSTYTRRSREAYSQREPSSIPLSPLPSRFTAFQSVTKEQSRMPNHMNAYRLSGDLCHLTSKAILILTIHLRKSAEGISLLTQMLYALVFLTRYTDIFSPGASAYVTIFKWTYILTSFYIIYVMLRVFKRSREEEREWRVAAGILVISIVLAPICWGLQEVIWKETKRGDWVTQVSLFLFSPSFPRKVGEGRHDANWSMMIP